MKLKPSCINRCNNFKFFSKFQNKANFDSIMFRIWCPARRYVASGQSLFTASKSRIIALPSPGPNYSTVRLNEPANYQRRKQQKSDGEKIGSMGYFLLVSPNNQLFNAHSKLSLDSSFLSQLLVLELGK
jgi:hypothetical protein